MLFRSKIIPFSYPFDMTSKESYIYTASNVTVSDFKVINGNLNAGGQQLYYGHYPLDNSYAVSANLNTNWEVARTIDNDTGELWSTTEKLINFLP